MQLSTVIFIHNPSLDKLRKEISKKFHTSLSIKEWNLHMTLASGVSLSNEEFDIVSVELKKIMSQFKSFKVELSGFDFRDNFNGFPGCEPYVAQINVKMNKSLLELHNAVESVLKKYPLWHVVKDYNPHVTLAYGDLNKDSFLELKKWLGNKKIEEFSFNVTSFCFAKHEGLHYRRKEFAEFYLAQGASANS